MAIENPLAHRAKFSEMVKYSKTLPTPHIIVDLALINSYYDKMAQAFNFADIYYAVKSNPANEIVSMLDAKGSHFDIASRYELDQVLALGVDPAKLFYGNTIKKKEDIAYFYSKGVRTFASDSENDVRKMAKAAPGANVYFRLLLPSSGSADWPLSRKFGCNRDMLLHLIPLAKSLKLNPIGVSFHVGSQQRDVSLWGGALQTVAEIFKESEVPLSLVNMGGGFPARYDYDTQSLASYAVAVKRYVKRYFPNPATRPRFVMEPGRSLVADSGILVAEVVEVAKKDDADFYRWVFLDAGKFNGMIETIDECITYTAICSRDMRGLKETGPVILAGPTCDSMDIMYENHKYELPLDLKAGDRIYFLAAGAYTSSYASVCFNGFPPIKTHFI